MSELLTMVIEQGQKIVKMESQLQRVINLLSKDKINDNWIDENIAAEMIGYEDRNFRRKVKKGNDENILPWSLIKYRHSNNRNFQYNRKSLIKFQEFTSNQ